MKLWGRRSESEDSGPVDPEAIRARSKAEIERLGGRVIDWLPLCEVTLFRDADALAERMLVLNALANLAREAPMEAIRDYVASEGLDAALTPFERRLLIKETDELTSQEIINASWYDEAIYALAWAGGLMSDLLIERSYPRELVDALPNVERAESGASVARRVKLRPYAELFAMRDLYYRAHWYTRDGGLNGYDTGVFNDGWVMERRKALEWLLDAETLWDEIELHT